MPTFFYEDLEDSFPQLRREREVQEELRKAEQAHAYLESIERGEVSPRAATAEYMEAENDFDESLGRPGLRTCEDGDSPREPPKRVVNMRDRNERRKYGSMADLPKEDIFGLPLPPPRKQFPAGGRRLGGWGAHESVREAAAGLLYNMPDEDILLLLALLLVLFVVLLRLWRSRADAQRRDRQQQMAFQRAVLHGLNQIAAAPHHPAPQQFFLPAALADHMAQPQQATT